MTGLLAQFTACFRDARDLARSTRPMAALVRQRVYALALGYEDLNDHDQLRHDPLIAVLAEADDLAELLAGKSTPNRLELSAAVVDEAERYKEIAVDHAAVDRLFVDAFERAHAAAPEAIVLDLDATDGPVHGAQEGRFFHGFYGHNCYLPLYIFAGERLFCGRLRPADIDSLMTWAEAHRGDYVVGLAKNDRLAALLPEELTEAAAQCAITGAAARVFAERTYQTRESWSRARRTHLFARAAHPS